MGFRIHEETIESSFKILKENMERAFPVLKEEFLKKDRMIRKEEVENTSCFKELISGLKWELKLDEHGNGISIYNHGLNIAEEYFLFNSIAEFMEDESYVIYEREGMAGNIKMIFEYRNGKVFTKMFVEDYDQYAQPFWSECE